MKGSDNPFPSILLADTVDPAAPSNGFHRLFIDTDEKLKMIDHASLVTDFTPGAGGDITTDAAWAAKGDLIVGTANNTAAILTAGTNGKVLTAASGEATGLVWDSHHHGVLVGRSTTSAHGNTSDYLAVAWDAEEWDTDAFHDNSTNNSYLTIPAGLGGTYLFVLNAYNTGNNQMSAVLRVDGSSYAKTSYMPSVAFTSQHFLTLTTMLVLTAGQYVQAMIKQASSNLDNAATWFGATKIG
jgi:hypothetical protein